MASLPAPIRVLLVDDHQLFRESIARLLGADAGLEIVGACGTVDEALAILRDRSVDLVLLDFDLGPRTGVDFLRRAESAGVAAKVLIVTADLEPAEAAALIGGGVAGIFFKRDSAASLAASIRDVMAGRVSFDEATFRAALAERSGGTRELGAKTLTKRERDVLGHVLGGLANKEIGDRLGVSESSVKATLQQLFGKTGVRTRSQLVRIALERYKDDL
jgi:DNA-binding NarL/FixJ family response regulator